jgi:hypothetical protein
VVVTGPLTIPALLDKLAARHAAAEAEITDLRKQIGKLTDFLAATERDRDRWAETRETVLALAAEEHPDPAALTRVPVTPGYSQIIAVFTGGTGRLRAKEICRALGTGTDARHVEGMRSKLKKLVTRGILDEPAAGLFALAANPDAQRTTA